MLEKLIRGVLSGVVWFATGFYCLFLADFSRGLSTETVLVLLAAIAAQAAVLAVRVPRSETAAMDRSSTEPTRPSERTEVMGGVTSRRDIVFGDRTEGTPPPAREVDRDTRIGGDVEADGDITFGNHHSDRDRR